MAKQVIKVSESQLKRIISESVKRVLNEDYNTGDMWMDKALECAQAAGYNPSNERRYLVNGEEALKRVAPAKQEYARKEFNRIYQATRRQQQQGNGTVQNYSPQQSSGRNTYNSGYTSFGAHRGSNMNY